MPRLAATLAVLLTVATCIGLNTALYPAVWEMLAVPAGHRAPGAPSPAPPGTTPTARPSPPGPTVVASIPAPHLAETGRLAGSPPGRRPLPTAMEAGFADDQQAASNHSDLPAGAQLTTACPVDKAAPCRPGGTAEGSTACQGGRCLVPVSSQGALDLNTTGHQSIGRPIHRLPTPDPAPPAPTDAQPRVDCLPIYPSTSQERG